MSAPLHFRTVLNGPFSAKWPSGKAEACKAFTPGSNPGFASRQHPGAPAPVLFYICGHGSVGRAQPCQGWGRGFEPRCPLQVQQPDYHGSRAFSYPLQRLEPERERALSKRGAFVASWRGRRQAAEAGADPRSGYADAPLSAPTILRGSNEPRFLLTLREPRAPHLAPQSSVAYIKYASLLFRGNLGHPEPARCRDRGSGFSVLFTNRSIRPGRLEAERERASWGVAVALFAANNSFGRIIVGITQQMDYLERLGIEAIWLSPFYPSPLVDGGYDVADNCDVDPRLGSLDDFDDMVAAAHARGIKVIVDIVPNHSSNQHPWFKAALAAGPGSPERARYIFRDGRGEHGELPPTNWNANFGGPAWTRVADGQWYLHMFTPEQPDFDWSCPEVHAFFCDVLTFWSDRGVDGFRIDVAHGLAKDLDRDDLDRWHLAEGDDMVDDGTHLLWDRNEVHEIYRERRARAALLLELALPGSAYVYQGEELGLFEVADVFVRFARASQNFSKKVLA